VNLYSLTLIVIFGLVLVSGVFVNISVMFIVLPVCCLSLRLRDKAFEVVRIAVSNTLRLVMLQYDWDVVKKFKNSRDTA